MVKVCGLSIALGSNVLLDLTLLGDHNLHLEFGVGGVSSPRDFQRLDLID